MCPTAFKMFRFLLCFSFLTSIDAVIRPPRCPAVFCPSECGVLDERGCLDCSKCHDEIIMFCKDKKCPPGTRCREVSFGCENVPEGAECDPMIEARCEPACPDVPCGIKCRFGLAYDENGCQLCRCLPDPCASVLCLPGTTCEAVPNDECEGVGCPPYRADCKLCKPNLCKMMCPFGFEVDHSGCPLCKCKPNPCLDVHCPFGGTCVFDPTSPQQYKCQNQFLDLCCPEPILPRNLSAYSNVCRSCFLDCTTMKCGRTTRCCPDYFGCYGCRQGVPCSSLE